MLKTMKHCAERLQYYGGKCEQHLSRVRVSHMIAVRALARERFGSDVKDLLVGSFAGGSQDLPTAKLQSVLNEIHLVALKANFELFLNRVLTAVWTEHFSALASKIREKERLSLRDLAESLVQDGDSETQVRDFIVERIIPGHGLRELVRMLKETSGISLPGLLSRADHRQWAQIHVAFEVRHLVEHRDGKVDRLFRKNVDRFWSSSSWGQRHTLEKLRKIRIEAEDVTATYDAMMKATQVLTEAILDWNSATEGPSVLEGENAPRLERSP